MAFENLIPHQSQILGLMDQGRTLAQISDILTAQHGVVTTPGTLSRFASSLKPARAKPVSNGSATLPSESTRTASRPSPELTQQQHAQVDAVALFTELDLNFRELRIEQRESLSHLARKIAVLSAEMEDRHASRSGELRAIADRIGTLDTRMSQPPPIPSPDTHSVPGALVARIWWRAFVAVSLLWLIAGAAGWAILRNPPTI